MMRFQMITEVNNAITLMAKIWKYSWEVHSKWKCNHYIELKSIICILFLLSFRWFFGMFIFAWRLNAECKTGEVRVTKGFNLPAKYIIHTVGPIYSERYKTAAEQTLYSCYRWVSQSSNNMQSLATLLFYCCDNQS